MITLVNNSKNAKLGDMSATYGKVGFSCPSTCSLLESGCYAKGGMVGIHAQKSAWETGDKERVTNWLNSLPANRVVRLNVSGDVFLNDKVNYDYIEAVNDANIQNLQVYSYTHDYTKIDPTKVKFALNASCDTLEDVVRANNAGWATVTVVSATETRRRWSETVTVDNEDFVLDMVLCPSQSVGLTCSQCKLCMNVDRPFVVAFSAHGASKNIITKRLEALQN